LLSILERWPASVWDREHLIPDPNLPLPPRVHDALRAALANCRGRRPGIKGLKIPPRASAPIESPAAGGGSLDRGAVTQGNESRLTAQWSQDFQQVLWVPRGALAASLDGSFVGDLAYQIEREVANHSHVLGAVADAQA
jgi:hypothetical protein